MKIARAVLLVIMCAARAHAVEVRVGEIGLQGVYSPALNTRIRVMLSNPGPQAQTLRLEYRLTLVPPLSGRRVDASRNIRQADVFTQQVTIGPGEQQNLNVPLQIGQNNTLDVEVHDNGGNLVASDHRALPRPTYNGAVAVFCAHESSCQAIQNQLELSDQQHKDQYPGHLERVMLRAPAEQWWVYLPATLVVVGAPTAPLTPVQRAALEGYLRQGGALMLLEREIADATFLAEYRRPNSPPQQEIGLGTLYRASGADDPLLRAVLSDAAIRNAGRLLVSTIRHDELGWAETRLATNFRFPTLVAIILWLAIYIVIVGPLNFFLLRKFGRLEWGWITVPALGVLFSVGLYIFSAATKPSHFGLDEVAVDWMDDRSPLAAAEMVVRVSAPYRKQVQVEVAEPAMLGSDWQQADERPLASFASSLVTVRLLTGGQHIQLGPPAIIDLNLARWSFRDLSFRQVEAFPGTVRRLSATRLRNETGDSFREAIYVDQKNVYLLGTFPAGQEADLAAVKQKPLVDYVNKPVDARVVSRLDDMTSADEPPQDSRKLSQAPFSVTEFIRSWPKDVSGIFRNRSGLLFAISEEPVLRARLANIAAVKKNYRITIVSFAP